MITWCNSLCIKHSSKQGAAKINTHCGARRYMNLDRISCCIDTPIVINLLLSGVLNMRRPSVFITDLCVKTVCLLHDAKYCNSGGLFYHFS